MALAAAPSRKIGKVETVYQSPGPHPNGLQATSEGVWIVDRSNHTGFGGDLQDDARSGGPEQFFGAYGGPRSRAPQLPSHPSRPR